MSAAGLVLGGYLGLFLSAFVAATLLPMSSEAVLAALSAAQGFDAMALLAVATLGNTLGAAVNWGLGRYCLRWAGHRRFPFTHDQLTRAGARFGRYGKWSLLFAWLPIVGDPLTFAAGVLGVRILPFTILVATGKAARYAVVLAAARAAAG